MGEIISHNAESINWPIKANMLIDDVEQNVVTVLYPTFHGYEIVIGVQPFDNVRAQLIYGVKNRDGSPVINFHKYRVLSE